MRLAPGDRIARAARSGPPLRLQGAVQGGLSERRQPDGTASTSSIRPRTRPPTARPATTAGARCRSCASSRSTRPAEGGVAGPAADGNIDDPQFQWLKGELSRRSSRPGRGPVRPPRDQSLTCNVPDEVAPPCTGAPKAGHDQNPGCDGDPRSSSPIHLGARRRTTALLLPLPERGRLGRRAQHVNNVTPFPGGTGGGFWMIHTAAEATGPQQSRLIEIMDNHDGTLSIFGTMLDHASNARAPASGTSIPATTPTRRSSPRSVARSPTTTTRSAPASARRTPAARASPRTATSS